MDGIPVSVMVLFQNGQMVPKAARYGARLIRFQRVTLRYQTQDGERELWVFHLQGAQAVYTLEYEPAYRRWRLIDSWAEGGEGASMET